MGDPVVSSDLDSLRREFTSEIGRVEAVLGTQIGAVEKTLTAKFDGMKWKILGGVTAQVLAAIAVLFGAKPEAAQTAIETLGRVFS